MKITTPGTIGGNSRRRTLDGRKAIAMTAKEVTCINAMAVRNTS